MLKFIHVKDGVYKNESEMLKKEVLQEIKIDHLATNKDLQITEASLKSAISQSQIHLLWAIVGIITTIILKHP